MQWNERKKIIKEKIYLKKTSTKMTFPSHCAIISILNHRLNEKKVVNDKRTRETHTITITADKTIQQ